MRTLLLSCLVLAGCANTAKPVIQVVKEPVEVRVPVSAPCVEVLPQHPSWTMDNPQLQNADVFTRGINALAEIEQRRAYIAQLEALLRGCMRSAE